MKPTVTRSKRTEGAKPGVSLHVHPRYQESEDASYIERTRNAGELTATDKANVRLLMESGKPSGWRGRKSYSIIEVDRKTNNMRLHVEIHPRQGSRKSPKHLFFQITVKGFDLRSIWFVQQKIKGVRVI